MAQELAQYASRAANALTAACDELRDITAALDARQRERRMQALRQMHPTQIMALLADIAATCGASNARLLDKASGRGNAGATWLVISIDEAIGEIRGMYDAEIEALRRSYGEARYNGCHEAARSQEWADSEVARIDENWKWGD